jgi:hypothetical protein
VTEQMALGLLVEIRRVRKALQPSDAPYLMAELEANEAMAEEHSVVEGEATVTQMPGGATFTHPHYEDATKHLRERWRELKETWEAR